MNDSELIAHLRRIVGRRHVLTGSRATMRFRRGYRSGEGDALCVVCPGTLLEQWRVLQTAVAADSIIIMQAANTGLTEGSTPSGTYDRNVVLINTQRIHTIIPLHNGKQVVACSGATLFALERLLQPLGREPHSVIGSSCIGASIIGGVCNNSGGSLVERGPAYTECALFARQEADGSLSLVNHLGIELGDTPEAILTRLEQGNFDREPPQGTRKASATDYAQTVRAVDAPSPARFNADTHRLYEASGCAGKLAVFAVRLDTYPTPSTLKTFYIGTNSEDCLTELRRHILTHFTTLPVSAEYMEREAFTITERYGKDTVLLIDWLGTKRLPTFFAWKGIIDAYLHKLGPFAQLTDYLMQGIARLTPRILPKRILAFRDCYRHHLILTMRDEGIAEAEQFLPNHCAQYESDFISCTKREASIAALHRFAAAGAAVRYMALHRKKVADIVSLDIALKRNDRHWYEQLPPDIGTQLVAKLYYGHFMCHVLHQDYIIKKGANPQAVKAQMLALLDARGAQYPAEHNVGHLYTAKPQLAEFYRCCDPTNSFNPGIGTMSKKKLYA